MWKIQNCMVRSIPEFNLLVILEWNFNLLFSKEEMGSWNRNRKILCALKWWWCCCWWWWYCLFEIFENLPHFLNIYYLSLCGYCSTIWWRDINIYIVFSALVYRLIALLGSHKFSFCFVYGTYIFRSVH